MKGCRDYEISECDPTAAKLDCNVPDEGREAFSRSLLQRRAFPESPPKCSSPTFYDILDTDKQSYDILIISSTANLNGNQISRIYYGTCHQRRSY